MKKIVVADHSGNAFSWRGRVDKQKINEIFDALEHDLVNGLVWCDYPEPSGMYDKKIHVPEVKKNQLDTLKERLTRNQHPLKSLSCSVGGADGTIVEITPVQRGKDTGKFRINANGDCMDPNYLATYFCSRGDKL